MEDRATVARPYAAAAFAQGREENALTDWSAMLELLVQVIASPEIAAMVGDPRVDEERLAQLVLDVCGERLSETGANFVRVLAANRRLRYAPEVAELFEHQREEHERRSRVEVVSAFELDEKQQDAIQKAMAKRLGRAVELSSRVDRDLIGGVVIRAGDVVIDGSVRGRLRSLAARID